MKVYLLVAILAITWHHSAGIPSPILYLGTELVDEKICKNEQPSVGYLECIGANSDDKFANLKLTLNKCSKNQADSRQHLDNFIEELCHADNSRRGYLLQDLSSCLGWLQGHQGGPARKEPIFGTAKSALECVDTLYKAVDSKTGEAWSG